MCDTSDDNIVTMSDNSHSDKRSVTARLSYQDKYDIICKIERGVNRKQLLAEYNLKNYSNLTCIVRNKEKIVAKVAQSTSFQSQSTFRLKTSYYSKVEEALILWIRQMRQRNIYLPASSILDKAKGFATELGITNFEPTTGYLAGLRRRNPHLFPFKRKESILFDESANSQSSETWTESLMQFIEHYTPEDVFCLQEFSLYYRLLPLRRKDKKSEDMITVVVICNADGSERMCSVIGSRKNPRALRGVKEISIDYYSQTDSFIDSNIYSQILEKINKQMKKNNRNVLLFVSNRASHSNNTELSNIRDIIFPQNCESRFQPLNQLFIGCIKRLYRKQLTELLLNKLESGSDFSSKEINLLDCITILSNSLRSLPNQFITSCFRNSNFDFQLNNERTEEMDNSIDIMLTDVDSLWDKLNSKTKVKFKTFNDYANVDDDEPVESSPDLSDDQILRQVKQERVDDSDNPMPEEGDEEMCDTEVTDSISTAEALNAISVLRRYFDQMSDNSVDQQLIDIQLRVIDNTTNGFSET